MGRKKKTDVLELYQVVRTLLPVHGYERLTLMHIASELRVARTTIY
ncbi:MAG: hypothetical protein ACRC5C_08620 [Bacilli bacterium]